MRRYGGCEILFFLKERKRRKKKEKKGGEGGSRDDYAGVSLPVPSVSTMHSLQ